MFIYTVKGTTLKFYGLLSACIILCVCLILFVPIYSPTSADTVEFSATEINYDKIKTNEDRLAFLKQFGWEAESEAVEEVEVIIPNDFDNIYTGYNEIQKLQGLDLSKYRRKTVKRYTYKLTNFDYNGIVYANIIIYRNRVIAGDICSGDCNDFICGFDGKL